MANTSIIIRMADGTRKAAVALPESLTIAQLLQTTQQKWNLPATSNYAVRIERTGEQLTTNATLISAGVKENDVLEIYPILEAG